MLQQDTPDDYVIGTGQHHTPREFCEHAFARLGLDYKNHVVVDPNLLRPAEVDTLLADPTKAKRELGWEPATPFAQLVNLMVDSAVERLRSSPVGGQR